jgi:HAD superfamily hydrolase (TIGR01509 family)
MIFMIRGILFDSDGVLIDSERMFFEAPRCAFRQFGMELTTSLWAKRFLGEGKRTREIAVMLGLAPSSADDLVARRNEMFWGMVDSGVPVLPGIQEMLTHLAPDYRLAIVTGASAEHFQRVHLKTGLTDFFEFVVTQDDYQQAKPSPEAYLAALAKLGLNPEECIAVEDSPRGASAAVKAGLRCCVVPTFLTDLSLCPEECVILDNIRDLVRWIDGSDTEIDSDSDPSGS